MMVEEHIHNLLFEHDCVIIPDFGGLITHYASAQIHPVKHNFSPPSKRIAFNEKLKLNDGLLISTLAYQHKLTPEEAQTRISQYVQVLQEALLANQPYEMKGIGVFRHNQEQKIQFEYIPADNFLSHSFGLPEIISRPVPAPDVTESLRRFIKEKQTATPPSVPQKTWSRRLRRVYNSVAVMAIAGLSTMALYVISLQNDYSQSSLNPFAVLELATAKNLPDYSRDFAETEYTTAPYETAIAPAENQSVTPQPEKALYGPRINEPVDAPKSPALVSELVNSEAHTALKKDNAPVVPAPTEKKAKEVKEIAAPATVASTNVPTTIKTKTNRYFVIAGGYSTLPNALYSRKVANRHGAQGKVILPFAGSKLYRVSIADFTNKEEALAYLPQLKNKYGKNIWILNY